jgi:hypothetical protein
MDETCFSETSVDFQRTTRRYVPKTELFIPALFASAKERVLITPKLVKAFGRFQAQYLSLEFTDIRNTIPPAGQ